MRLLSLLEYVDVKQVYLTEARKLAATGEDGERHIEKYIAPNYVGKRPRNLEKIPTSLELDSDHKIDNDVIPKGSRLYPIEGTKQKINGAFHSDFHVITPSGFRGTISQLRHSKVASQNEKSGKHSDEAAVVSMWNKISTHKRLAAGGRIPSVEEMHTEINNAMDDESHPLHISHAEKSEFVHGLNGINDHGNEETAQRAHDSYYKNLKNAAHTISALANHKDFAKHWTNQDVFEGSGRIKAQLSKLYEDEGVRGAGGTSKADLITVRSKDPGHKALKLISLKDVGGSQLMSSSPAEFSAIYKHALRQHLTEKHKPDEAKTEEEKLRRQKLIEDEYSQHINATKKINGYSGIDEIKQGLKNVTGSTDQKKKIIKSLDDRLQGLHSAISGGRQKILGESVLNDPSFITEVNKEAASGRGKFKTKEGTASHIVTIGKNAKVQTMEEWEDHHGPNGTDNMRVNEPRITFGKHGEKETEEGEKLASTAVRLDAPRERSWKDIAARKLEKAMGTPKKKKIIKRKKGK